MLWIAALPVLYFISRYNYNLFHSLADGISIAIAVSVFMIVWNARRILDNDYLLYVGISFLFFALIDLLHVLGNKNMGVFPQYGNLGPALYIASRYFISISLLIAPLFIKRKLNSTLMFAVYSLATALVLLSIFHWHIFPACIVEGVGLTPFKVISDYIICLILLGAVGFLLANKGSFDSKVFWVVVSSIVLSIATGVAFTLYADPFGITNAVGHFFQIASFYLIYIAIVETSVTKPQEILYRKLKQSEEELARNVERLDHANIGLMQEINERKKAEAVLEETRFMLSEGQRIAHVGSFEYVADTRTTVWSDEECRIYGLPPGTPSPAYDVMLSKFIHPDDAPLLQETFASAMQSGSVYELEHRIVRPDGSVRVVHDRARPYFDAEGKLVRYVGATLDITERKKAEEALRASEQRLIGVLESMPDAFVSFDADMRYTYVNANAERLQAVRREELLGKDVRVVYPDAESYKTISQYERVIREQKPVTSISCHAGFDRWVEIRAFPTPDGVSVFYKDVTAQVKAEQALRESEARFRLALKNAPVSVSVQNRELRYVWAYNQQTAQPGQIIGRFDHEIFTPEESARITAIKKRVLDEGIELREQMWLDRPKGRVFLDICWEPIRDLAGNVIGVGSATVDQTTIKLAEEALQKTHAQLQDHVRRLEETNRELEGFAYTVSHDLRAPLRAINGFAHMLAEGYGHSIDEEGKRQLGVIESNAIRMGHLIDDLLAFSRVGRTAMSVSRIDMHSLAAEALENMRTSDAGNIADIRITPLSPAHGDPGLVRQVLANLLQNAVKFSSNKPAPRIEVGSLELNGEHVYYVKDNGIGFDMKYRDKLFGVFQRLVGERDFEGTGVGLAIVHRIITRLGGRVWAESKLGEGATFYFTLAKKDD